MVSVAVVGLDRAGVALAILVARAGHEVIGISPDAHLVSTLNQGRNPFPSAAPGIARDLKVVYKADTFHASIRMEDLAAASIIFITTPPRPGSDGRPDLSDLTTILSEIGPYLSRSTLLITTALVPPHSTIDIVVKAVEESSGCQVGPDLSLVHAPLRLVMERNLTDLVRADHLLGAFDQLSLDRAQALFSSLGAGGWFPCTILEAEVAANGSRARVLIDQAFSDELAIRCEEVGVDLRRIRDLIGLRPAGPILDLGPVPGRLRTAAASLGGDGGLIAAAVQREVTIPPHIAELTLAALEGIPNPLIAVLGLADQPEGAEWVDGPSLDLISALTARGAEVRVHDPFVDDWDDPRLTSNLEGAVHLADAVVLATAHGEYRSLSLTSLKDKMLGDLVVDGRGLWDPTKVRKAGLVYVGFGYGG